MSRPTRPSRRWAAPTERRRLPPIPCGTLGERLPMALGRSLHKPGGSRPSPIFVLFTENLGSGLTMALGRWLDAAAADDDGEATDSVWDIG